MAAELSLKVNAESYHNRINILEAQLQNLYGILADYGGLKNDIHSFMENEDENFVAMQENVEANIDAVKKAIGMTITSKTTLEKMVEDLEQMQSNIKTTIEAATDAVKEGAGAAVDAIAISEML